MKSSISGTLHSHSEPNTPMHPVVLNGRKLENEDAEEAVKIGGMIIEDARSIMCKVVWQGM